MDKMRKPVIKDILIKTNSSNEIGNLSTNSRVQNNKSLREM
jgi:hypothetical protein